VGGQLSDIRGKKTKLHNQPVRRKGLTGVKEKGSFLNAWDENEQWKGMISQKKERAEDYVKARRILRRNRKTSSDHQGGGGEGEARGGEVHGRGGVVK